MRQDKGISKIAIVIIVVALLLAIVGMVFIVGQNGIMKKGGEQKQKNGIVDKVDKSNGESNKGQKTEEKITNIDTSKTNPEGNMPKDSTIISGDGKKGIVIKDKNNNEWVWIEVPKNLYTTAKSKTDYTKIEADLKIYTSEYKMEGWTDTWYEGCGIATQEEYNNLKNRMLSSVYENGGFWIGRYEVGTDTLRTDKKDTLTTPLIKQDKYPYNFVTISEAQTLAAKLNPDSSYTSNLMFGIQWDLILKYIEINGAKTQTEIKKDSASWGNYKNNTFDITEGKYSKDYGKTFTQISGTYTKPATGVILSTGVTERNKVLNIYDLAGNEFEWTLEQTSNPSSPTSFRGGCYTNSGSYYPAAGRSYDYVIISTQNISLRPTLYK